MPKVSVIVTCYNQEDYIEEALQSVLDQVYEDWECVIVNDGSLDNSEKVICEFIRKDSRFIYIKQKNQGVVAARNNAIEKSSGKYILPLDGDDKIDRKYLLLAVPVMEADEEVSLVYCNVQCFGMRTEKFGLPPLTLRNILNNGCCVVTSLFRRVDFDAIGGFKQCMNKGLEDWEFFISLTERGGKFYKIEKTLFHYRVLNQHRDGSYNSSIKKELIKSILSIHSETYYHEYQRMIHEYERKPVIRILGILYSDDSLREKMKRISTEFIHFWKNHIDFIS